jgi:hypothetical protein
MQLKRQSLHDHPANGFVIHFTNLNWINYSVGYYRVSLP